MATIKSWINAFRLRTLPLAISGWLVGTSIATWYVKLNLWVAGLSLITACLLQILSNLANDYGDAVSGVDSVKRNGPNRMVQSGAISKKTMTWATIMTALLCFISGCFLLYQAFENNFFPAFIFLIIGLTGIAAAIKYTVGKNPYGYAGFGDVFVFFFFGLVLVFGAFFLQVQVIEWRVLLPAASIGLFSVGVLNVNNIRDMASDKLSGKNSVPVRLGKKKATIYHMILLFLGFIFSVIFVLTDFRGWSQFLFLPIFFLLRKNIKAIQIKPAMELDPFLKQLAISTLLFSFLFSIGMVTA